MILEVPLLDELVSIDEETLRAHHLDNEAGLAGVLGRAEELLHNDPERAERLGDLCHREAVRLELPRIQARASYQRAQILAERGELEPALELIREARGCWLHAGDDLAALRTDLGQMQVLDDLGLHSAAIRVGEELLVALDRSTEQDPLARTIAAHATDNLGVAYGLVGRHESALAAYAKAEDTYLELGLTAEAARPAANRGVELVELGRPREALVDFARAIGGFLAHGDRLFAAQCQGDMARAQQQLGQVGDALRLLEQGRRTLDELGANVEAARLRLALAETYLAIGWWAEARSAARTAAETTALAGMTHDLARARFIVALADLARGEASAALVEIEAAERLFAAVGDRQFLARVQLARAETSVRLGKTVEAREQLTVSLRELRAGGWRVPLAWALLLQADVAGDLGAVEQSLDRARAVVDDRHLPELSYQLELRAGRLRRRQGRRELAEQHLRRAVDHLGRVSDEIPDFVLRTAFRAERTHAYTELIDLLIADGSSADVIAACALADEAKVQTLSDVLTRATGTGPDLTGGVTELTETYAELGVTYLDLQGETDPERRRHLDERSAMLEDHIAALRLRHLAPPERAKSEARSWSGRAADVPTVAFHVVGIDVVAFVLTGDTVTVRRLEGVLGRLHHLLDQLQDQWSRYALGLGLQLAHEDALLRSTRSTLADLHTLLVAPLGDAITDTADAVCFVPHAPMGAVPFHALFDGERYLVERWAITVAPTLAAAEQRDTAADHVGGGLVVGVADEYAPNVDAEARAVADLIPSSTLLVDADATVSRFADAARDARVVHLACHGLFRPGNPLFSRLRLGDRWMTSAEIVRLDLGAALVILSACESGAHERAAEPVGLGWAFLAAGATGLVVSQWAVHDRAVLQLMPELYRQLATGATPDQALREAQLHTARMFPHPFMWAPFTYVSNPFHQDPHQRPLES